MAVANCKCRDCKAGGPAAAALVSGTCIACKRPFQDAPALLPFSGNFNEWHLLSDGAGLCRRDHRLFADNRSRFSCWILAGCDRDDAALAEFKWADAPRVLRARKRTPFILYFTTTFKTQGFVQLLARPNYSNDRYVTAIDRLLVDVRQDILLSLLSLVREARLLRFTREEMLQGSPYTAHWAHRDVCERIIAAHAAHGSLWMLAVQADQTRMPEKQKVSAAAPAAARRPQRRRPRRQEVLAA